MSYVALLERSEPCNSPQGLLHGSVGLAVSYHSSYGAIMDIMKISISDVVIIEDNKVLLVQEKKQMAYALWNFPGGKLEPGETAEQAAYREIREELNVDLINPKLVKTYPVQNLGVNLDLNTFTGSIKGNIKIKDDELLAYGWFSLESVEDMKDKLRGSIILDQLREALASLN